VGPCRASYGSIFGAAELSGPGKAVVEEKEDEELAAIKTVLGALTPLKPEARSNVIDYVFRRLGITAPAATVPAQLATPQPASPAVPAVPSFHASPLGAPTDLRLLREQKQPRSVNHMVAVLAYYLAHFAPAHERRDHIVADDIKKYFPQANFELPTAPPSVTLANAKNAGYLDGTGTGHYRLNPVGHNLVTHKLPRDEGSAPTRRRRQGKKTKKSAQKTKA
jgi:hypothetical protein